MILDSAALDDSDSVDAVDSDPAVDSDGDASGADSEDFESLDADDDGVEGASVSVSEGGVDVVGEGTEGGSGMGGTDGTLELREAQLADTSARTTASTKFTVIAISFLPHIWDLTRGIVTERNPFIETHLPSETLSHSTSICKSRARALSNGTIRAKH